jgi:hypothetical protein
MVLEVATGVFRFRVNSRVLVLVLQLKVVARASTLRYGQPDQLRYPRYPNDSEIDADEILYLSEGRALIEVSLFPSKC